MTNQENQPQELLSSPEEMLDLEQEQLEAVIGGTGCCPIGLFRKKIVPALESSSSEHGHMPGPGGCACAYECASAEPKRVGSA